MSVRESMRAGGSSALRALGAALLFAAMASAPAGAMTVYGQMLGPADLGHVGVGDPLAYSHSFDVPDATVLGATLFVFTADQPACLVPMQGVSCDLIDAGGVLDVVVAATAGDFYVWRSFLLVAYQAAGGAGGSAPVATPEPGAAVLFGIGAIAVSRATRRRR